MQHSTFNVEVWRGGIDEAPAKAPDEVLGGGGEVRDPASEAGFETKVGDGEIAQTGFLYVGRDHEDFEGFSCLAGVGMYESDGSAVRARNGAALA